MNFLQPAVSAARIELIRFCAPAGDHFFAPLFILMATAAVFVKRQDQD